MLEMETAFGIHLILVGYKAKKEPLHDMAGACLLVARIGKG